MAHTYNHLYRLPTTGLVYGPWGRPDVAHSVSGSTLPRARRSPQAWGTQSMGITTTTRSERKAFLPGESPLLAPAMSAWSPALACRQQPTTRSVGMWMSARSIATTLWTVVVMGKGMESTRSGTDRRNPRERSLLVQAGRAADALYWSRAKRAGMFAAEERIPAKGSASRSRYRS
jgi:hypothetical protein